MPEFCSFVLIEWEHVCMSGVLCTLCSKLDIDGFSSYVQFFYFSKFEGTLIASIIFAIHNGQGLLLGGLQLVTLVNG